MRFNQRSTFQTPLHNSRNDETKAVDMLEQELQRCNGAPILERPLSADNEPAVIAKQREFVLTLQTVHLGRTVHSRVL